MKLFRTVLTLVCLLSMSPYVRAGVSMDEMAVTVQCGDLVVALHRRTNPQVDTQSITFSIGGKKIAHEANRTFAGSKGRKYDFYALRGRTWIRLEGDNFEGMEKQVYDLKREALLEHGGEAAVAANNECRPKLLEAVLQEFVRKNPGVNRK